MMKNLAIWGAVGFFEVFNNIHSKYFGSNSVPLGSKKEVAYKTANLIAYVVNGALACEVAMKSVIDEQQAKKLNHDLKSIYNSEYFENRYKLAILNKFQSNGLTKSDFDTVLKGASSLFVSWRFIYEENIKAADIPEHYYEFVCACVNAMKEFSCFSDIEG